MIVKEINTCVKEIIDKIYEGQIKKKKFKSLETTL
jgi:hypothetical protein